VVMILITRNLNFCLYILDVLHLYPHNDIQAEKLYQQIIKIAS
jgi:hypothetical protein